MQLPSQGRRRIAIEQVTPQVDGGRFPVKRTAGDVIVVEADVFADGHDEIGAAIRYRREPDGDWHEAAMRPIGNDRWQGVFPVHEAGTYRFTVIGWVDAFASWRHAFGKKLEAGQDVDVELKIGSRMVARARRSAGEDADRLAASASAMGGRDPDEAVAVASMPELQELMSAHADRRHASELTTPVEILVERERARSGAWYELFPRSASKQPGKHGTFGDVIERLPDLVELGFDVLYLPPIHPIGRTNRKGRNNEPVAEPGDVGSPWAIGSDEGGHTAVHPDLGTLADFDRLLDQARRRGIEVALDLAFQCAPDHPWAGEHPEWFRRLPDGSIRYAENPPKRYEDIYPLDFETSAWKELWRALLDVTLFWADRGVRIFRVDNPHTKPLVFWKWMIAHVRRRHPDVVFLAEAFTRPKVMHRLAKLGFSQSYTYFTWRTTKQELVDYFTELTTPPVRDFFRPNLWPNTPDILPEILQSGEPGAFAMRFVLAATLGASYGIYGPAFDAMEHTPREPGSEEYLNSEKYEIRRWDLERARPVRELIAQVNGIRREHPALRRDDTLTFHAVDNVELIAYSKRSADGKDVVLAVVNLDVRWPQSGWVEFDLADLGVAVEEPIEVRDLLSGQSYTWKGSRHFVELTPGLRPAHVLVFDAPVAAGTTPARVAARTGSAAPADARSKTRQPAREDAEPWEEAGS